MTYFSFFTLKANENYKLDTIDHFSIFHLTSMNLSPNTKKKASLYVIFEQHKFLLATLNHLLPSLTLDLWFHTSQKCEFAVEGAEIIVSGYYKKPKKEKSINDDDEFKAIAFKANKLGQELEKLHKGKNK